MQQFKSLRYPTPEQNKIWFEKRKGIAPSVIAKKMSVSRPYVSQAQRIAEDRITRLLEYTANVMRVDIRYISGEYGIAVGLSPALNSIVYITYTSKMGIQTWYGHDGNCSKCDKEDECMSILKTLSEEWDIPLSKGPATKVGLELFKEIRVVLDWEDE